MINLKEVLTKKYQTNELSHFYTISCPLEGEDARSYLNEWVNDFLCGIISFHRKTTKEKAKESLGLGPADIQFISTENKTYNLTSGDFDNFFTFLNYRPSEFLKKFLIVTDSHKITDILANKLLKTLEEPPTDVTIIFLNPNKSELLPTITSRTIALNIPIKTKLRETAEQSLISHIEEAGQLELAQVLKTKNISAILNFLKSKKISEESFLALIRGWAKINLKNGQELMRIIKELEKISHDQVYHGALQTRLLPLIHRVLLPHL